MNDVEWIEPQAAVALLQPRFGKDAKSLIISRCQRGLLEAKAAIVVRTYHNRTELVWNGEYERHFEESIPDSKALDEILPQDFWSLDHADTAITGTDASDGFGKTVFSDWEIADFGFKQEYYVDGPQSEWERCEAAGVRFNREQLGYLVSKTGEANLLHSDLPTVRTKYDWERAIAAFAGAQQKLDLVPDLYEHGAQARIERWLADWFSRFGQCPAEPTIRPRAALILAAYKKADRAEPSPD